MILINDSHSDNQALDSIDRIYGGKASDRGYELWGYNDVNLAKVSEAMGALGIRVEKPSELRSALD